MTFDEILDDYHKLEHKPLPGGEGSYNTKLGVRGYPDLSPATELLLHKVDIEVDCLLDVSGSAGVPALVASTRSQASNITVLDSSFAALRAAQASLAATDAQVAAGVSWNAPANSFEAVFLLPQTDKGSTRVLAELQGAHHALQAGGCVYLVMHKNQGAKRYEKVAKILFGELEVLAKRGGWRLCRAIKCTDETQTVEPVSFKAAGLDLTAEPGVFAAGKLDPGTALFLEAVDMGSLQGKRVLELGCGYGLIALKAALAGAEVTALDDDLLAVRSSYRNARHYGLDMRCLHSDVDAALKDDERFEVVLMNPPFHVGKQVQMGVPRAFLAAAEKHLEPGGKVLLVANKALAYEKLLANWADVNNIAVNEHFKVLAACSS